MPDFTSHMLFGNKCMRQAAPELKEILTAEPSAFFWGLQGPDVFFYHKPLAKGSIVVGIGHRLHSCDVNRLFILMQSFIEKNLEDENLCALLSYFYGFTLHYFLDFYCHPYVGALTRKRFENERKKESGIHIDVEGRLDDALYANSFIEKITDFKIKKFYTIDSEKFAVIERMWQSVTRDLFRFVFDDGVLVESMKSTVRFNALFYRGNRFIRALSKVLEAFLGCPYFISGHFKSNKDVPAYLNLEKEPWLHKGDGLEHNESYSELFDLAMKTGGEFIAAHMQALEEGEIIDPQFVGTFEYGL